MEGNWKLASAFQYFSFLCRLKRLPLKLMTDVENATKNSCCYSNKYVYKKGLGEGVNI